MASENARKQQADTQERPEKTNLVKEYRKVGPAAINAALLCKPKKEEPKRSYEPREET